jgi:hypothetical protein
MGATLANTFQSGYDEPCQDADPSGCTMRNVGSYTVDLQGRYTGFRNDADAGHSQRSRHATAGVEPTTTDPRVGIDPTYADPRGRMFGAIRMRSDRQSTMDQDSLSHVASGCANGWRSWPGTLVRQPDSEGLAIVAALV